MEINLRNVPFSEDLLFFIRRCAGDASDLEIRLRHVDLPSSVYEVWLRWSRPDGDVIIVESDPDVFLAVRNAFEILKVRDHGERALRIRAALAHAATDAHS